MKWLEKETFVCLDCESTGLDTKKDRIIEVAVVVFNGKETISSYDSLFNPECVIPPASIEIHHITQEMVSSSPKIASALPHIFEMVDNHIIIGHGINFDLEILAAEAERAGIPYPLKNSRVIDTLRLARDYGDSPTNALATLGVHFNIPTDGAHRAMNDVLMNIEVFKQLASRFKSLNALFEMLAKPILLKNMPLGKHKGRSIREVPLQYLQWAAHKDFDRDLLYTIRTEIKRRKKGSSFEQSSNPFKNL